MKKPRAQELPDDQPFPIYLDHHATTPLGEDAWAALAGARHVWGNPSSAHAYGSQAKHHLELSRREVSAALGCTSEEVFFTSGGTEANNMAIAGGALAARLRSPSRNVIVASPFEHPAATETLLHLEKQHHFSVRRLHIDPHTGVLDVQRAETLLRELGATVALVVVMHVNNELGTVQPVAEVATLAKQRCGPEVLVHCDAAQSIGRVPVHFSHVGVDLLSVCGHKFYGPKGAGALLCRSGTPLEQVSFGAQQENGRRPGTENVLLCRALSAALTAAVARREERMAHAGRCRSTLVSALKEYGDEWNIAVEYHCPLEHTVSSALCVALRHRPTGLYVSAPRLIMALSNRVAMSAGAACHSSQDEATPVVSDSLNTVRASPDKARGTLRLTTGDGCQQCDMRRAAKLIMRSAVTQMPAEL